MSVHFAKCFWHGRGVMFIVRHVCWLRFSKSMAFIEKIVNLDRTRPDPIHRLRRQVRVRTSGTPSSYTYDWDFVSFQVHINIWLVRKLNAWLAGWQAGPINGRSTQGSSPHVVHYFAFRKMCRDFRTVQLPLIEMVVPPYRGCLTTKMPMGCCRGLPLISAASEDRRPTH